MKLTNQPTQKTVSAPDLARLLSPQLFADVPRRVGDLQGPKRLIGMAAFLGSAFATPEQIMVGISRRPSKPSAKQGSPATLPHVCCVLERFVSRAQHPSAMSR